MINEVIRARVAASGFAPEHVDAVAARLTATAEAATRAACLRYIDAVVTVINGDSDYRFSSILSIAMGQPTSDATGRKLLRFQGTNGRIAYYDQQEIVDRYGALEGLTDDPVILADAAGLVADPFPFRFIDDAATPPEPLSRGDAEYDDGSDDDDESDDNG